VFNTTFNNISVISWLSVLLMDETGRTPPQFMGLLSFKLTPLFNTLVFCPSNLLPYSIHGSSVLQTYSPTQCMGFLSFKLTPYSIHCSSVLQTYSLLNTWVFHPSNLFPYSIHWSSAL
jgi:hypothetical protein